MADLVRIKLGFRIVLAGLAVILIVYGFAIYKWNDAADVATAVGSVSGVVGTIVGAFFGVHIGAAGKEKAEQQRDRAQEQVRELSAKVGPDLYEELRRTRPHLFDQT